PEPSGKLRFLPSTTQPNRQRLANHISYSRRRTLAPSGYRDREEIAALFHRVERSYQASAIIGSARVAARKAASASTFRPSARSMFPRLNGGAARCTVDPLPHPEARSTSPPRCSSPLGQGGS